MSGSITNASNALEELLNAQMPELTNRVYKSGTANLYQSGVPRITYRIHQNMENPWIGEGWGSGRGVYEALTLTIRVWDRNPATLEATTGKLMNTIRKNRGFHPAVETEGYFVVMFITGVGETELDQGTQLYSNVVSVSATWLDIQ